jgi:hypothetical protein
MPYPPRPPRKAASLKALELYRPKPGQSGNPLGFPRSRREQLEAIERLAREASPEMIEVLQKMARHSEDDRVRTMAATKLLEFLPKVKEDSAGEGSFVVEKIVAKSGDKYLRGRPSIEYHLSIDMAKHLALMEKSKKGFEIRDYFIQVGGYLAAG